MRLYEINCYKAALRHIVQQKKKHVSAKFTLDRLAKACNVQTTYLSRVLNGDKGHLNDDQLHLACDFLGLSKEEENYLDLLKKHQKSSLDSLRKSLWRDIENIRQKHLNTETFLQQKLAKPSSEEWHQYFLNPNIMLVHVFLTVQKYRKDLASIATALRISREELNQALTRLEKLDIIGLTPKGYEVKRDSIHLGKDSPIYQTFRLMHRLRTIEKFSHEVESQEDSYSLSVSFSSKEETKKLLQAKLLKIVGEIESDIKNEGSKVDDVYQLNIDLFSWGR